MRTIFASILFTLSTMAACLSAEIIDGDTIRLSDITYRIEGIDAPEVGQRCTRRNGDTWRCGQAAIEALASLIGVQLVQCAPGTTDGYGRTVAKCSVGSRDIGAYMVRSGHAWAFVKYSNSYVEEERLARSEGVGIWQAESQPAWEYRAAKWNVAQQQAPDGCPIKGNISKNGRIYHPPWSPWYSRTRINTAKGERWFCSEAEAIEAGWRAPAWR